MPRLVLEIKILSNLIKRKVFEIAPPPCEGEFTDMQGRLMGYLLRNAGRDIFQRDIEKEFCIRRSTASRFLRTMEEHGMIRREAVPQDARLKKIMATPQAAEIHAIIEGKLDHLDNVIREGISDEEIEQFRATLQKLKNNLS